jgi:hypothetical protein
MEMPRNKFIRHAPATSSADAVAAQISAIQNFSPRKKHLKDRFNSVFSNGNFLQAPVLFGAPRPMKMGTM